jgi:hypothetical protein
MADDVKESLEQEMIKEDEHTPEVPGQMAEQVQPGPSPEQHDDTEPKKDASDPHAQKGA